MVNAPWLFEPSDWFGFFERHGWSRKEIRFFFDEGQRLGRPAPISFGIKLLYVLRGLFMSKQRQEKLRQFAGYAMLEPK
jgi:hypothetical protein